MHPWVRAVVLKGDLALVKRLEGVCGWDWSLLSQTVSRSQGNAGIERQLPSSLSNWLGYLHTFAVRLKYLIIFAYILHAIITDKLVCKDNDEVGTSVLSRHVNYEGFALNSASVQE